eukprot:jgi/Ulvmu1/8234/UM041_0044.1
MINVSRHGLSGRVATSGHSLRAPRQSKRDIACSTCSSLQNQERCYTDQTIKRIQDLPAIANGHVTVPILAPVQDDLPFAMSLEICIDKTCCQPSKAGLEHPMCELLYFLEGSGLVTVIHGREESVLEVCAGDSVLAAAETVCVEKQKLQSAEVPEDFPVTFLRVILPLEYVVGNAHNPQIAEECRKAATQATRHWAGVPTKCAIVSNVFDRLFAVDGLQLRGAYLFQKLDGPAVNASTGSKGVPSCPFPDLSSSDGIHRAVPPLPQNFQKVSLLDAPAFQLPNQQNRLALVLDPVADDVPFTFGVEIFPPGFQTPPHVHDSSYEMFFIVSGFGATAFCNGHRTSIEPGDVVVFRPGCVHGIDTGAEKVYCLELLLPNQDFAEMVRLGQEMTLDQDDSCILAAIGCGPRINAALH